MVVRLRLSSYYFILIRIIITTIDNNHHQHEISKTKVGIIYILLRIYNDIDSQFYFSNTLSLFIISPHSSTQILHIL